MKAKVAFAGVEAGAVLLWCWFTSSVWSSGVPLSVRCSQESLNAVSLKHAQALSFAAASCLQ